MKILVTSSQPIFVGGCSLQSFMLHEILLKLGHDSHLLSFQVDVDGDWIYGLPNTHKIVTEGAQVKVYPEITQHVKAINPDIIIGFGVFAPAIVKLACPEYKVAAIPMNSAQLKKYIGTGKFEDVLHVFNHAINTPELLPIIEPVEGELLKLYDIIIPTSKLMHTVFNYFWDIKDKVKEAVFSSCLVSDNPNADRPFSDRPIDVLFAAYRWTTIKNREFVEWLYKEFTNRGLNTKIVGLDMPNSMGLIQNKELYELYSKTKIFCEVSRMESGSNVLIEAIRSGCNVITSANTGNSYLLPSFNVIRHEPREILVDRVMKLREKQEKYTIPSREEIAKQILERIT